MLQFKEFVYYGKHAKYAHFLAKEQGGRLREDGVNVFNRLLDVYLVGAAIGIRRGVTASIDNSISDKATIQLQQIVNVSDDLEYLYRLIMLLDDTQKLSEKERISRAFKADDDPEQFKVNMKLFNSYALGGLEILYEYFKDDVGQPERIREDIIKLVDDYYIENL